MEDAEDFLCLCSIAVRSHRDLQARLPFWGGGCQPGQPGARGGPTITFSHLPFLECCRSGAGMDRRSRACMATAYTVRGSGRSWPDCGHPKHGPAPKHAEEECHQGHSGLGVSCLRVIGKRMRPVNGGKKNEDGTAQQHGGSNAARGRCMEVGASRTWSLGHENWALTRSLPTSRFVPASCHNRVLASAHLGNKGTVQMQMRERDRNESKMHIIKKEAGRGRDEHQSRWLAGSDGS